MRAPRKRLTGALALAVAASGLILVPSAPATANPSGTGLVVSEVYTGGGATVDATSDYIVLFNPTSTAVNFTADNDWYISSNAVSATGGSNMTATKLTGTIPAKGHFLISQSATVTQNGVTRSADFRPSAFNSGASGAIVTLWRGTASHALAVGQDASQQADQVDTFAFYNQSNSREGATVPASTVVGAAGRSAVRKPDATWTYQDTNSSSADIQLDAAPKPESSADVVSGEPAPLAATSPGNKTGMVGQQITGFTLQASGGATPYEWEVSGLPNGLEWTSGGAISGTPSTEGTFNVTATVADGADATDDVAFTYTIEPAPEAKSIAEIQGTGARSTFAPPTGNDTGSTVVTTQGVVTARYATGGFNGMYIQTPSVNTEGASDAIFVYAGSGNANIPAGVEVGDAVQVTGRVAEFYNLTQLVPANANAVVDLGVAPQAVEPREIPYPTTDEDREVLEGELIAPTDEFTVTNNYSLNQYAEIGLATGTTPLRQPTEYASPNDLDAIDEIKDENYVRGVILDDGQTTNFLQNQTTKAIPLPWLTPTNPVRVGAAVTFQAPVILDWRNDKWKFQPTLPVTDDGSDVATFEDTRTENLAPANVGGDLTIATFNVLNYFNTTGEAYAASGALQSPPLDTRCTYYTDRQSNRIGNNSCGVQLLDDPDTPANEANSNDGRGPRGAATAVSLARQEDKLANTINTMNADVIGLEEVENSIKLPGETNRDDALARIVEILNEDAGEAKWAYVRSPGKALTAAAVAEQDVIRGAFIYQRDRVQPVGQSDILFGTTQFANAREPLAQAFKAKGAPDSQAFAVIVNHFKSKGDNADPAPPAEGDNANDTETGVGAFNGDRVRQAERLVQFADEFAADRDIDAVFLAGDFNSYSKEEPIARLEAGGYTLVESDDPEDESYSYQGLSGSLDHVLGNAAAQSMVTGADIWEINADESPAFQYSRFNYNVTNFWQPELPFATSDHNPEIVGIDVPEFEVTSYREIQVIGTNDFHGRLLPDGGNAAGAAPFATAVDELKAEVPDSIFVAAGDLVGASTFESFVQDDEPTIDALNAMDLEVSAAGNHEFDRGYDDFLGRIRASADWEYIAANVHGPQGGPQLAPTFIKPFGDVKVGFVGAVTEDLLSLVNPELMDGVTVDDVVESVNEAAADLKEQDADLVVLLVHEGSPSTECSSSSFTDPATVWGNIVQNTSADVDAIISGHTHLAYNCRYPVADWVEGDRAVTKRPVVSAGQYGTNLNQLVFKLDEETGELAAITQDVVAAAGVGYAPDPEVQEIVDDALLYAAEVGGEVLGEMTGPFKRASYTSSAGATENRGGESTLGNQVAEVQRWATDADLALMNPGGLRADMLGTPADGVRDLTYRQAADVQPFANTLVSMELTGAQIEKVLEQQWQRNAQGGVPSRPFLRLGVSEGFTYTYVETPETVTVPNSAPVNTFKGEITGMWLDGEAIDPEATYTVTVNSFLGTGGDNFWELANGADKVDTGKVDLEAMVDYMEQYGDEPLEVDYRQRAVEVTFPNDAPDVYGEGDALVLDVASWSMTAADDLQDSQITVMLGDTPVGDPAAVDNTVGNKPYDNYGTAQVSVTVPAVEDGTTVFTLVGNNTGTEIQVPVRTSDGLTDTTVSGEDQSIAFGRGGSVPVTVDPASATGTVTLLDGELELGETDLTDGAGTVDFERGLAPGVHVLTLVYSGDSTHNGAESTVRVTVAPPVPTTTPTTTTATVQPMTWGADGTVNVTVTPATSGSVTVTAGGATIGSGTVTAGSGTVTIDGEALEPGTHTLTVRFAGNATHDPSQATVSVTVVKAATTLSATTSAVAYGSAATISVSATPTTAEGAVTVTEGGTTLGEGTLVDGADLVTVAAGLEPGTHTLTVAYAGDDRHAAATTTVTLVVNKAASTTSATITPGKVQVESGQATITVTVAAGDLDATGTVTASAGGSRLGSATVSGGKATLKVGPFAGTGTKTIAVRYSGDDRVAPSATTVTVDVVKADTSVSVSQTPKKVKAKKTQVRLAVKVRAEGFTPGGWVSIQLGGQPNQRARLNDLGNVKFTLQRFGQPGDKTVTVTYEGNGRAKEAGAVHVITVVR